MFLEGFSAQQYRGNFGIEQTLENRSDPPFTFEAVDRAADDFVRNADREFDGRQLVGHEGFIGLRERLHQGPEIVPLLGRQG